MTDISDDLINLRSIFLKSGFDIRFVGGCVRDWYRGLTPKDIDLCTDATPDEQIDLYKKNGIRHIPTGLAHGTVTVVLNNETYEITSLRKDVETDGRRAAVEYTKDWLTDLQRRDFTFNAMTMDFYGNIFDPFDGRKDLDNGNVKFVGDPNTRIKEDYLRILRYVRFRGRFGDLNAWHDDEPTINAIMGNATNLSLISRERIWSEFQKILMDKNVIKLFNEMEELGILKGCDLPNPTLSFWASRDVLNNTHHLFRNPVTIFSFMYNSSTAFILNKLKASTDEINLAKFISDNRTNNLDMKYLLAVKNARLDWVYELGVLSGEDEFSLAMIEGWEIPNFPVSGYDLIRLNIKPGPEYKKIIGWLKEVWAKSDYTASKEDLLTHI